MSRVPHREHRSVELELVAPLQRLDGVRREDDIAVCADDRADQRVRRRGVVVQNEDRRNSL